MRSTRTVPAVVAIALAVGACASSGHTAPRAAPAKPRTTGAAASSATAAGSATTAASRITPIQPIDLYHPLSEYTSYVDQKLSTLRPELRALRTAAVAGDVATAEHDWLASHVTWLEIGEDDAAYGAFGSLGQDIDGLPHGLPGTTTNRHFTGFHKIELDLWRRHDSAAAAADTSRLISLTDRLTHAAVASDLPVSVTALDSWILRCHEILEDALRDVLSQSDDYGSNSDLASLQADVAATGELLGVLEPVIDRQAPHLVASATRQLQTIDQAITAAGGPTAFRTMTSLPARRRQALDSATGGALETLAPVSDLLFMNDPGA
jgi:high-affinity iron transporter